MKTLSEYRKSVRAFVAGTIAASAALIATNAMADPVLWEVDAASPAASLTGTFVYDADTNVFSDIDLSGASSFLPLSNEPIVALSSVQPPTANRWFFRNAAPEDMAGAVTNWFILPNGAELTNAGGSVPGQQFTLSLCVRDDGSRCTGSRNISILPGISGHSISLTGTPIIIDEDEDGVLDTADLCPGTVIPEATPTSGALGPNRYALTAEDVLTFAAGKKGKDVFTTEDTGGCSCEQIAEAGFLGNGHLKKGCSVGEMRSWVNFVSVQ